MIHTRSIIRSIWYEYYGYSCANYPWYRKPALCRTNGIPCGTSHQSGWILLLPTNTINLANSRNMVIEAKKKTKKKENKLRICSNRPRKATSKLQMAKSNNDLVVVQCTKLSSRMVKNLYVPTKLTRLMSV